MQLYTVIVSGDDEQSDWVGDGASGGRGVWEDSDRGEPMEDDLPQGYRLLSENLVIYF